jgi:hypothetical protein
VNPKEVALAHFEKAILGVCIAVAAWYLYSVLSIKPYARKPEEFTDATSKARNYVTDPKRTLPETEAKELTSINFAEQASRLFKEYVPDDIKEFIHLQRWVRPFDYGINFRNEPKILAASQPKLQPNRGLMQTYLIDAAGNIKKHKVKKSQQKFARTGKKMSPGSRGRSGQGDRRRGGGDGTSSGMEGSGGEGGMDDEMMMGSMMGRGGGGSSAGMSMGGLEGPGSMGVEDEAPGGAGPKFVKKDEARNKIIERMNKKSAKDEKKEGKQEEEIEEPIESREGYRFVEICATFPHSLQIEEYVRALRERARDVKLQYASVDVERSELTPNFTWTEFKSIPIKEQFDYVSSAIGVEAEFSRALVPGLAMNIPVMDIRQREYLHLQFPIYEKPEQAMYTREIIDPIGWEADRERKILEEKRRNPNWVASKKKDAESEKKILPGRGQGVNLGFNDPKKQKEAKDGRVNNHYQLQNALVRYWDFTVEPGRKYKYRIRVKVFNPNYKRTDVADPDMASRIIIAGPWSPTSEEVFVDFDNHWYVADQKRGGRSNELFLEVHHWYRDLGEWLVATFPQRVGQFVGLADRAKPMKTLKWNDVVHDYEVKDLRMETFDTSNLLVGLSFGNEKYELFGGERGVAVPKEAVALNPFGDLVRHEEQIDKQDDVRKSVNENFADMEKAIAEVTGEGKKEEKEEEKPKKGKAPGRGGRG